MATNRKKRDFDAPQFHGDHPRPVTRRQFVSQGFMSGAAYTLDAATKRQLDRGARTVEVLKQPQYSPMAVEQQVMIIYAVTNGHLDDVAVNKIRDWERGFHEFMAAQFPQVGDALRKEKALSKDTEAALKQGIESYKKGVK